MINEGTSVQSRRRMPEPWRAFAAFLPRPALPQRATGFGAAPLKQALTLWLLDLVLMAAILCVLLAASKLGLQIPANAIEGLDFGPGLLAFTVLGAPLMEEIVFRGWLSGRPGHVWAVLLLIVGGAVPIVLGSALHSQVAVALGYVALLVLVAFVIWRLRHRGPWRWFARHFGWFFYASTLLFAASHMLNYTEGAFAILAVMTIPQFLGGMVFAYARVTYGLWASVMLHVLHNGLLISLVLLAERYAG